MQRRRVSDEGLRVVKLCLCGTRDTCKQWVFLSVHIKKVPANSVPAAAVIQRVQALFGIIGRKARQGGLISQV